MRVLYAKANIQRKKKFQIITKIIKIDNDKYVIKESLTPEAKEFITEIYNNSLNMKKLYPTNVLLPQKKSDALYYPFLNYPTLEKEIFNNPYKEEELIKKYISFLKRYSYIKESFTPSNEYKDVFGSNYIVKNVELVPISNIDILLSNIFLVEENFMISDCEWVFDFEVPLDYIIARALIKFSEVYPIDIQKYLPSFNEHKDIFYKMEENFQKYIANSNYLNLYKKPQKPLKELIEDKEYEIESLKYQLQKLQKDNQILQEKLKAMEDKYYQLWDIAQSMRLKNRLKRLLQWKK